MLQLILLQLNQRAGLSQGAGSCPAAGLTPVSSNDDLAGKPPSFTSIKVLHRSGAGAGFWCCLFVGMVGSCARIFNCGECGWCVTAHEHDRAALGLTWLLRDNKLSCTENRIERVPWPKVNPKECARQPLHVSLSPSPSPSPLLLPTPLTHLPPHTV